MKILVAIFLSFLISFQSVGIGISDLFMLNELIDHVDFHAEEHGDDFFDFFEKHYGSLKAEHEQTHQEEKAQHQKLPFQHYNLAHISSAVIINGYEFYFKKPLETVFVQHNSYYLSLYSFVESISIFQPPQKA